MDTLVLSVVVFFSAVVLHNILLVVFGLSKRVYGFQKMQRALVGKKLYLFCFVVHWIFSILGLWLAVYLVGLIPVVVACLVIEVPMLIVISRTMK